MLTMNYDGLSTNVMRSNEVFVVVGKSCVYILKMQISRYQQLKDSV
jgi:hypothetical protein